MDTAGRTAGSAGAGGAGGSSRDRQRKGQMPSASWNPGAPPSCRNPGFGVPLFHSLSQKGLTLPLCPSFLRGSPPVMAAQPGSIFLGQLPMDSPSPPPARSSPLPPALLLWSPSAGVPVLSPLGSPRLLRHSGNDRVTSEAVTKALWPPPGSPSWISSSGGKLGAMSGLVLWRGPLCRGPRPPADNHASESPWKGVVRPPSGLRMVQPRPTA